MDSRNIDKSSDKKFPVSLEFFKKHIQYEELVDAILKDASRGDDEKFKESLTCERKRENCIKNYYTYFYTKPRIRERWPFKLKPMPKGIKAKLLEIPEYAKKQKKKEKNHADHRNQNNEDLQFPKLLSSFGPTVAAPLEVEGLKLPSDEICKDDDLNKNIIYQPNCDQDIRVEEEEFWNQNSNQRVPPENVYAHNSSENINSAENIMEIDNRMDTDNNLGCNVEPSDNGRKEAVHILENLILVPAIPNSASSLANNIKKKNDYEEILIREQSNLEITKDKQNEITASTIYFSGIFNDEFLLNYISRKCHDTTKQQHILKLIKEKFPHLTDSNMINLSKSIEISEESFAESKRNSAIDEAKILLFCNVHKTHTLSYVLRTRHGLKYEIVENLLSVTLEEFQSLVHIYEADELKCDSKLMDRLYHYVTTNMKVWPINLFIKLEDLFNFLKHKHINFHAINQNVLLEHISPKFFHWSDLQNTTNFFDCVRADYLRRYAVKLDVTNAVAMEAASKDYYNRCWKYDEWIHQIPVIKQELIEYLQLSKEMTESDVGDAPSKYTGLAQHFSDFLIAPNNQHQINMSPHELIISESLVDESSFQSQQDPINNSIEESADRTPISLGVIIPATETKIKSEPFEMLKNLQFYIDGDDDDLIHCTVMNSEPILLDETEIDLNCSPVDLENKGHSRVLSLTPATTCESLSLSQTLPYLSHKNECDEIANTPSFILPDDPPLEISRGGTNDIQVVESESDNNPEYSCTQNTIEDDEAITSQIRQEKQRKITDFVNTNTRQVQHKVFVSNMHDYIELRHTGERQPAVADNCTAEGHQSTDIRKPLETQDAQAVFPSSKMHIARKTIAHKNPIKPTIFVPQLRHKFPSLVTVRCATNFQAPPNLTAISKNTTSCDRGNAMFTSNTRQPPNQVIVGNNNSTKSGITNSSNSSVSLSSRLMPIQLVSKTMLYRTLCQIDYFQSISSRDIAQYELPTIVVDSTYLQAVITCDGIKMRLCNKSLSALFPQWTPSLKQDLFIVLRDLTEYHYSLFDFSKDKFCADIRTRVLHYLFRTASPFSLGNLSYELSNPEFGYCYPITNNNNRSYKRRPHATLTEALKPSIVAKIIEFKRNL
ncbi:uncharacterized protein LOC119638765 isoform X1 [Glossina fuscipes]|uniref:Uncharacterized protein LOC119638765 isoform X1 n=1 Tax=Glossina fuscipes TaxID=7396 RepID=A0A9C5Z888_9MUSC|nr:uncharacterized protein LOC119638765 isoform X1 [Glossina fuscipes]